MKHASAFFVVAFTYAVALEAGPIAVDTSNPHYYSWNGRPVLLITSAEHYGAVINGEFDYVRYLDALKENGLNYTRIYPGALFEPIGKFMTGNTLGPRPRSLVLPWARSATPGYMLGGNKFDLDKWNPAYFARLHDFIAKAAERGIAVEICFFNSQYSDTWPISALYHENNVQGAGTTDWRGAQSLSDSDLVRYQSEYVRKITREVNSFDNVILEICDEAASIGSGISLAGPWVSRMVDVVRDTERTLPNKHLLGQEVEGPPGGASDFSGDSRVPVVVAQYIWGWEAGERGGELGGMKALDTRYGLNKPIELNETDYYPLNYRGDRIADSRVEAWEFMVGGGAAFNQLNGLFTVENPSGRHPDSGRLFLALRSLRAFLESFEFIRMRPDRAFVAAGIDEGTYWRALAEPGRQYAIYMHHSGSRRTGSYEVVPGNYAETLTLKLPPGEYRAEWVEPATGEMVRAESITAKSEPVRLSAPRYSIDIALRMKRM